MTFDLEIKVLP